MNLEALYEEYRSKYVVPNLKRPDHVIYAFEKIWLPRLGTRSIRTIKRKEVIDHLDEISEKNGGVMANRCLAQLRACYNWAIDRDLIETNPCWRVKKPHKETPRSRHLTIGQLATLWQSLEKYPNTAEYIRDAVKLIILTGSRKSEVTNSTWANWDLVEGMMVLETTKNATGKAIPLPTQAVEILKKLRDNPVKEGSKWVFPTRNKRDEPIADSTAIRALKVCCEAVGLPRVSLHDLRRSTATAIRRLGCSAEVRDKVLNHRPNNVTAAYDLYALEDETREALQGLADQICG